MKYLWGVVGLVAVAASVRLFLNQSGGALPPDTASPPPPVVLTNVTLIDGRGGPPLARQSLEIRDGRIWRIRPSPGAANPVDAAVLDLSGHYVIPGLIDSHVHLLMPDEATLRDVLDTLFVGGITAVRDMAGNGDLYARVAPRSQSDTSRSARLYYSAFWAGPSFFAADPRVRQIPSAGEVPWMLGVTEATDLVSAVSEAKAGGAAGIKIYSNLSANLVGAITAEAHRQGMKVWSHPVVFPTRPRAVVESGVDAISHSALLVWESVESLPARYNAFEPFNAFGPPAPYASVPPDAPPLISLLETARDRGVILEATLSTMDGAVSSEAGAWASRLTALAHRLGVSIAAGTDRAPFVNGAPALFEELEALVGRAGLTPLEAIRAATLTGAEILGIDDELGSIEAGKIADLVVLQADPSADIRNARRVVYVMKAGHLHRSSGS